MKRPVLRENYRFDDIALSTSLTIPAMHKGRDGKYTATPCPRRRTIGT